jgi:hypothetical protein
MPIYFLITFRGTDERSNNERYFCAADSPTQQPQGTGTI